MHKEYKIRSPLRYWIVHGLFILALGSISINHLNMQIFVVAYLCIIFWYAFSHKFILDDDSRQITEKAYGIKLKTINVDRIKEYFVKVPQGIGLVKNNNSINCLVSLKLESSKGEELKQYLWNISFNDAKNMFSEAAKINTNIIAASEPFYESNLYKDRQSKYLLIILIPIIIAVILYFFYLLNQGLNP